MPSLNAVTKINTNNILYSEDGDGGDDMRIAVAMGFHVGDGGGGVRAN